MGTILGIVTRVYVVPEDIPGTKPHGGLEEVSLLHDEVPGGSEIRIFLGSLRALSDPLGVFKSQ